MRIHSLPVGGTFGTQKQSAFSCNHCTHERFQALQTKWNSERKKGRMNEWMIEWMNVVSKTFIVPFKTCYGLKFDTTKVFLKTLGNPGTGLYFSPLTNKLWKKITWDQIYSIKNYSLSFLCAVRQTSTVWDYHLCLEKV